MNELINKRCRDEIFEREREYQKTRAQNLAKIMEIKIYFNNFYIISTIFDMIVTIFFCFFCLLL